MPSESTRTASESNAGFAAQGFAPQIRPRRCDVLRARLLTLPRVDGRRGHVETISSALKHTTSATIAARRPVSMTNEALLKALAQAIRRWSLRPLPILSIEHVERLFRQH